MRETSITLTEIKELERTDPEELWEYYYWIKALKMKESREMSDMEHDMKNSGNKHKTISFPKDFVSQVNKKVVNLEE